MFFRKKINSDVQLADCGPDMDHAPEKFLLPLLKKEIIDWSYLTPLIFKYGRQRKLTQTALQAFMNAALASDPDRMVFVLLLQHGVVLTPAQLILTLPQHLHPLLELFLKHDASVRNDAALTDAALAANWAWVNLYLSARAVTRELATDLLAIALKQNNIKQARVLSAAGGNLRNLKKLSLLQETPCDVKDTDYWREAKIIACQDNFVQVNYNNWPAKWNEWIDIRVQPERFAKSKTRACGLPDDVLIAADWQKHMKNTLLTASSPNDWTFVMSILNNLAYLVNAENNFLEALIGIATESQCTEVIPALKAMIKQPSLITTLQNTLSHCTTLAWQVAGSAISLLGMNLTAANIELAFEHNSPAELTHLLSYYKDIHHTGAMVLASRYRKWACVQTYLDYRDPGAEDASRVIYQAFIHNRHDQLTLLATRRQSTYHQTYVQAFEIVRAHLISKKNINDYASFSRICQLDLNHDFILQAHTDSDWEFVQDYLTRYPQLDFAADFLIAVLVRARDRHPASAIFILNRFLTPLHSRLILEEQHLFQELMHYYELRRKEDTNPSFLRLLHTSRLSGRVKITAVLKMMIFIVTGNGNFTDTDKEALDEGRLGAIMRQKSFVPSLADPNSAINLR